MSQPIASGVDPEPEARAAERSGALARAFASEAAFRSFYDRTLPRVFGYVLNRCGGDRSLAEDLTQQTFVDAVRQRHRFDGRADPLTWLIGIARHKLADHYRRLANEERRHLRLVLLEADGGSEAGSWLRSDEREAIVRALAMLPAMQRAVLVLHYADGLPVRDIARELGKSESSIESLLTRARLAFRAAYGGPTNG